MDSQEILNFCLEKGFLLDKEILSLLSETNDKESLKLILEKIKGCTHQKVITKNILYENQENVRKVFSDLPFEKQKILEKLKIKLGLSIEISKESEIISDVLKQESINILGKEETFLKKTSNISKKNFSSKKLEVNDFVKYFRNRFSKMKEILQEHSELNNLISINKLSSDSKGVSIIGLVLNKGKTKNKNIILEVEDLTGRINLLINKSKTELYEKAEEIALDSVVGFKGSGNKEVFFANEIIFPDSFLHERKKSSSEEYALFIGDLHFGSKLFLRENFLKFIDYLNGKFPNTPEVEKIKYIFIAGDLITGVGVYPNQESDLEVNDLEEQYLGVAGLLSKIRKDIQIIVSPGNHDGVRLMEPQPVYDEKYAWPLYEMENVLLIENPAEVKIGVKKDFAGFNVLVYHGFSYPFYANNVPRLMKKRAMNFPEEIMTYLLKNRHLAPTHASVQYFPSEDVDYHLIENVPDIFVSAHTHKSSISYYNNILVVSTSCWESMTPYQEKFGNEPDHCKVPMINLKTRAVKILDFE